MTTTATERARLTVLRAAWMFDGPGSTLIPNPSVVLDGETIIAVDSGAVAPDGATVVDLGSATLLPGLIDTHVHLAFDAGDDVVASLAARADAAVVEAMTVAARAAVHGGVTTVRDLGDRDYLSLAVRDSADPTLPTIVAAGPPITSPGGHCHYLGSEAVGAAGVRAAVQEHVERGVDVIKIMASGGNLTSGSKPELSQFGLTELRVAVAEAHRHGLPITAHAHGTQAITDAVDAGVDGLEHITFMTADGVDPAPPVLVRSIADKRITLGMTVGVKPIPGAVPPPAIASRLTAIMGNARLLHESGAPVTAGTDAGLNPLKPHDVLRYAVGQLGQIGMSPAAALRASTWYAAQVCGLGHRKGRIAPGFDADILAVDGNPLEDPEALHRIQAVYCRGRAIRSNAGGSTHE